MKIKKCEDCFYSETLKVDNVEDKDVVICNYISDINNFDKDKSPKKYKFITEHLQIVGDVYSITTTSKNKSLIAISKNGHCKKYIAKNLIH